MAIDEPSLSDAEWKVMNAIWAMTGEITARDVHASLQHDTEWAYTTLKTLMDRLVQKGALSVEMQGNVSWYRSKLTRQRAISAATRDLMRRAFGGAVAPLVHHLIRSQRLSAKDKAELRRMLDDAGKDEPNT